MTEKAFTLHDVTTRGGVLAPVVGILKGNVIEKFQSRIPDITGGYMNDCITNKTKS